MIANNESAEKVEFVFGGTFDPVHLGHLAIIRRLKEIAPHNTVRLIPCAVPALKAAPGASFIQRCEMLSLAMSELSGWKLDRREEFRAGASYTVDTLRELHLEYPDRHWVLVMGADSLADFKRWHCWQDFSNLCHLLVLNRPGINEEQMNLALTDSGFKRAESFDALTQTPTGLIYFDKMPEKPESSSQIRQNLSAIGHEGNAPADYMLPDSVIEYIRSNRLYKSEES